jgi:DNA-binding response OmpR family regulator
MSLVLLIDDEPGMGQLVRMSLDADGARVVQVGDLAGAIAAAREERPSAVLLDLSLGPEDGLAILPRLREEPSLADVPIIVFSIHDSRQREAFQEGADGFVAKPFKAANLRDVIEEHIGSR